MKRPRRFTLIRFLLALVFVVVAVGQPVAALAKAEGEYVSTRDFITLLQQNDLKYSYQGVESTGDERVRVSYTHPDYQDASIVLMLFFEEDCESVSIRAWNLVHVTAGKAYTLDVVNRLNSKYKYTRFNLDESDNTITCAMDCIATKTTTGAVAFDAMQLMLDILNMSECSEPLSSLK